MTDLNACVHPDPSTLTAVCCTKCGAFKLPGGELQYFDEHGNPKRIPYRKPQLRLLGTVAELTGSGAGSAPDGLPFARKKNG